MSNHDMFSVERNSDSYMMAFIHGRLLRWNLKPMMGSGTTEDETLVQHEYAFWSCAKKNQINLNILHHSIRFNNV